MNERGVVMLVLAVEAGCGQSPPTAWRDREVSAAPTMTWDEAFGQDNPGDMPAIHARGHYQRAGVAHPIELWRDGRGRLRRRTDDAIDLYVEPGREEGENVYSLLDWRRMRAVRVSEPNLARIGVFTTYEELATWLSRPPGASRVVALDGRASTPTAVACTWFRVELERRGAFDVCWSRAHRIAVEIEGSTAAPERASRLELEMVEAFDRAVDPREPLTARGMVVTNADEDLGVGAD